MPGKLRVFLNFHFSEKNRQKSEFSKSFSSITHFPLNNLLPWCIIGMCVPMRPIDWRVIWVGGMGGRENFHMKTSIFSSSRKIISSREQVDERNMMQSCWCDLGCKCVCVWWHFRVNCQSWNNFFFFWLTENRIGNYFFDMGMDWGRVKRGKMGQNFLFSQSIQNWKESCWGWVGEGKVG